MKMLNVNIIW